MLVAAHAAKTIVGEADLQQVAAFDFLAPRLLGMDGCRDGVHVSLRGGFINASAIRRRFIRSMRHWPNGWRSIAVLRGEPTESRG